MDRLPEVRRWVLERALRVRRAAHDALVTRRDDLAATYPALFGGCYVNASRYRAT